MTSGSSTRRQIRVSLMALLLVAGGGWAEAAAEVKIPLTVRSFSDTPVPPVPVWTGVPLPCGAVAKTDSLRLLDSRSRAVAAQFDVQATWADGSVKWVLVSFLAAGPLTRRGEQAWTELQYTVVDDASMESPAPSQPVRVRPDTNDISVTTGPLQIRLNRHGFRGISQTFLDIGGDGQFDNTELIGPETESCGIIAVDAQGTTYASGLGRVRKMQVERSGPMHAVVAFHGDLRGADASKSLLNYAMRVHTFAGLSLVRVVLTIHNPRPAGRADDGSRWVLGQSGRVKLQLPPEHFEVLEGTPLAEGERNFLLRHDVEQKYLLHLQEILYFLVSFAESKQWVLVLK